MSKFQVGQNVRCVNADDSGGKIEYGGIYEVNRIYGRSVELLFQTDRSWDENRFEAVGHDMVNYPPHYNAGDIECIDAIRAAMTPEEFAGFCKGNVIKYLWRANHKGGVEDHKKAAWYLAKLNA